MSVAPAPAPGIARSRPRSRWILPPPADPSAVARLMEELRLPAPVCRLLVQRGYGDVDPAKRYLRPRIEHLHDPGCMLDLDRAVERIVRALRGGERILVHGDYDVDGICSTTLLVRAMRAMGGDVVPFIPRRIEDGYDLSMAGVRAAIECGAKVLLTCDCGTNAIEPVREACRAGIDVIISDHHLPSGPLPECLAVLNPRRDGCEYPDKDLCAAGIAFKLALAVARAMEVDDTFIYHMLDLVALATIADIAPLRGENRVLARYGLRVLDRTRNPGLRALISAAGLSGKPITAGRVGFMLAPRLNAVGRIRHAMRGVELLLSESEHEANTIARELEELNRERQDLDRRTVSEAMDIAQGLDLAETFGVVIAREGWHPGVIGIVASRLVEALHRPVVLVALDGAEGKGSGRSIPGFDLHSGLAECRDLLVRFGGHRAAAGVTIASERVNEFAARFNAVARERIAPEDLFPETRIDLEVELRDATLELESLLRHFEPFGAGNATPVLMTRGVRLHGRARTVGQGHLKLCLTADDVRLDAIGFGMESLLTEIDFDAPFDVAYRLERDEYNGSVRLQAKLAAIRPH